jgi:hypothetical protein
MKDIRDRDIRWGKVIWMLLTNKHFKMCLKETILYGLINQAENRGSFASGVMIFDVNYTEDIFE